MMHLRKQILRNIFIMIIKTACNKIYFYLIIEKTIKKYNMKSPDEFNYDNLTKYIKKYKLENYKVERILK